MLLNKFGVDHFFVVRTPKISTKINRLLPYDSAGVDDVLKEWVLNEEWSEALYIATPSLLERAQKEFHQKNMLTRKTRVALIKYLIRMSNRATPFGLFSGVSLGFFSEYTDLQVGSNFLDKKKNRLDMGFLYTVRRGVEFDQVLRRYLKYKMNQTFIWLQDSGYYIETYFKGGPQYRVSKVKLSSSVRFLRSVLTSELSFNDLVGLFVKEAPSYSVADVADFISSLIDEGIIVSTLSLPLTDSTPASLFINGLPDEAFFVKNSLASIESRISTLDKLYPAPVAEYKHLNDLIRTIPFGSSDDGWVQTDFFRKLESNTVSDTVRSKVDRVLLAINSIESKRSSAFDDFIMSFHKRFEGQAVPLLAVLNDEIGIGFSKIAAYESYLLAGINFDKKKNPASLSYIESLVFDTAMQAEKREIKLASSDILKCAEAASSVKKRYPFSYSATVSIYYEEEHEYIKLHGVNQTGAGLMGRFCHLDDTLKSQVVNLLDAEQSLCSNVILAEVVHMPNGKHGNVIVRPKLRKKEIVFLGDSSSSPEDVISLEDLYVYIEENRVKLWSKELNRQVLPRLTCAHNFRHSYFGIYRFLTMLSEQYGNISRFTLPDALGEVKFVPRVVIDDVIVSECRWRVSVARLKKLVQNDCFSQAEWELFSAEYRIDEWVSYIVGDNSLVINLKNIQTLSVLIAECRNLDAIYLYEVLHEKYRSAVSSESGLFAHEVIIPWFNPQGVVPKSNKIPCILTNSLRRFGAGSEWLSIKLYASPCEVETVLIRVSKLIDSWKSRKLICSWFFIRYGDPDWHLRLRVKGDPETVVTLLPEVWKEFGEEVNNQKIQRIECSVYERELERYGGLHSIELVERVFMIDSEFASRVVKNSLSYSGLFRIRAQLLIVFAYMELFLPEIVEREFFIERLRSNFGLDFNESPQFRQQVGRKFRGYKDTFLNDFYNAGTDCESELLYNFVVDFKRDISVVANSLIELSNGGMLENSIQELLSSLTHMSLNRLSKFYGREEELVIYDFCRRLLLSFRERKK